MADITQFSEWGAEKVKLQAKAAEEARVRATEMEKLEKQEAARARKMAADYTKLKSKSARLDAAKDAKQQAESEAAEKAKIRSQVDDYFKLLPERTQGLQKPKFGRNDTLEEYKRKLKLVEGHMAGSCAFETLLGMMRFGYREVSKMPGFGGPVMDIQNLFERSLQPNADGSPSRSELDLLELSIKYRSWLGVSVECRVLSTQVGLLTMAYRANMAAARGVPDEVMERMAEAANGGEGASGEYNDL